MGRGFGPFPLLRAMASATNVRLLRQQEKRGDIIHRISVWQFTIDIPSVATNSIDVSTAALPGVDPAKDFVLGVRHTDDISHAVIHEFHVGAVDTLHILTHNNTAGPVDPTEMEVQVIIGRMLI